MSGIYGFWQGPTYRPSTREEQWQTALDLPMSMGATAVDQSTGEFIGTYGVGTIIQEMQLPPAAPGRWYGDTDQSYADRRKGYDTITEEEYKASPYFRENLPWDNGMTKDRAAALAMNYDAKRVREHFASKRPITSFIAGIAGQALDPINYIPVLGPSVKAAAVARMGVVKGIAATAALDAAANTAIAGLATRETRRSFGDDVSWQAMVSEIATAALLGTAFGTVGGLLERRAGLRADALRREAEVKVNTLRATQEARIALNEAIGGLATDGEVRLSPNATAPIERIVAEASTSPRAAIGADVVEPPVPPGMVRVYHSGQSIGEGETGRWVSTNRTYASDYRRDLPLHYLDLPENDPRLVNADIPEQGVKQGFTFNFETTPQEAAQLRQIKRTGNDVDVSFGAFRTEMEGLYTAERKRRLSALRADRDQISSGGSIEDTPSGTNYALGTTASEASNDVILGNINTKIAELESAGAPQIGSAADQIVYEKWKRDKLAQVQRTTPALDISPARPDPIPEGRAEAEAKVAKPENYKALADQYRVDPETGTFPEEAELRQLAQEGRLSEEDMAVLDDADAAYQDGASYGEALKSVVGCLV